jgi:hypothetical protein
VQLYSWNRFEAHDTSQFKLPSTCNQTSHTSSKMQSSWLVNVQEPINVIVPMSSDRKCCRYNDSSGDRFHNRTVYTDWGTSEAKVVMRRLDRACPSVTIITRQRIYHWVVVGLAASNAVLVGYLIIERRGVVKFSRPILYKTVLMLHQCIRPSAWNG